MIFSLNILIHNILLVLSVSNKKAPKASTRCWIWGDFSYLFNGKEIFSVFYISVTKIECFFYYALIIFLSKIYLFYQTKTKSSNENVSKIWCFSQKYDFVLKHLVKQMTQILEESIPCTAQLTLEYPQLLFFEEYNLKIKTTDYGRSMKA